MTKKVPEGWSNPFFSEIIRHHSGNSTLIKGRLRSEAEEGCFPAFSASGQDVWHETYEYEGEAIVVSAVGSRCGKAFSAAGKWSAIANTHVVWPKKEADIRFLHYYLNDENFWVKGGSGQPFVLFKQSFDKRVFLPPLPEQEKIAKILGSVDEAIAATRQVIERTRSLKRSLTQTLLTKGIPGRHKKFKDSPLGKIPEDWRVEKGERLFNLGGGHAPADIIFTDDGDVLYLKVDDFNNPDNQNLLVSSSNRFFKNKQKRNIKLFQKGTIVFPKRGAAIFKNRVRQLGREATIDSNLMCLEATNIVPEFFVILLEWIGLHHLSDNSGIPQLNNKHLYPIDFLVPPEQEQREIVRLVAAVDSRIFAEEAFLSVLDQKKRALLSALLSGDIRVPVHQKQQRKGAA